MLQAAHPTQPTFTRGTSHDGHNQDCSSSPLKESSSFRPPDKISISHPWVSRHHDSAILHNTKGSDLISTTDKAVYGHDQSSIAFRIGNGGAGWTGLLKFLSLKFIEQHGGDFRVAWVVNHSRHSQTALLADIVQVALTYEPDVEGLAVKEGWCRRVCAPAFWDHFILVGPRRNPAGIARGASSELALQSIARHGALFHTRGDGSATHEKEQKLWRAAGVDLESAAWIRLRGSSPYEALQFAAREEAYLITDRATFLTAKRDGVIPDLAVFAEREEVLLNPCSALVNTRVPGSEGQRLAIAFAEWLAGDDAQGILKGYGKDWGHGMPLFTGAEREDFGDGELLAGCI